MASCTAKRLPLPPSKKNNNQIWKRTLEIFINKLYFIEFSGVASDFPILLWNIVGCWCLIGKQSVVI